MKLSNKLTKLVVLTVTIFLVSNVVSVMSFDLDPGGGGSPPPPPPPTAKATTIKGYVRDSGGKALGAIAVRVNTPGNSIVKIDYTDKNGYYSVTISIVYSTTFTIRTGVYDYGWIDFFSDGASSKSVSPGGTYRKDITTNALYVANDYYTYHWIHGEEWSREFTYGTYADGGPLTEMLNWAGFFASQVGVEVDGSSQSTLIGITSSAILEHDNLQWINVEGEYCNLIISDVRVKYEAHTAAGSISTNNIFLATDPCYTNVDETETVIDVLTLIQAGIQGAQLIAKGIASQKWLKMGIDLIKLGYDTYKEAETTNKLAYLSEYTEAYSRVLELSLTPTHTSPIPYPLYTDTRYMTLDTNALIEIPAYETDVQIDITYEFDLGIYTYRWYDLFNLIDYTESLETTCSYTESFIVRYENN